ncbi:MAG TPA: HD domain-containing protein [Alphaproteobacteria bacterium]|nr:HD domain-containing protein [Alphaproteobacteria bacterium]
MPDDVRTQPLVQYRRMEDGTKEEYKRVFEHMKPFEAKLPDRIMTAMALLRDSYSGEMVNRLVHSLQTATRAQRDGRDEEYVVAALIHDIGDLLATENHAEYAAAMLKPYVRPYTHWTVRQHGLFQGYYYFHHFGLDRNARDKHRGHPAYEMCVEFCAKYDQTSFDPDYDTMPLEAFEPMVRRIFAREPWGPHTKEQGGYDSRY